MNPTSLLSLANFLSSTEPRVKSPPHSSPPPLVTALTHKINLLNEKDLPGVCVTAHWLAGRVLPLKKQVYLGWDSETRLEKPMKRLLWNF
jgi:hypothetical protein